VLPSSSWRWKKAVASRQRRIQIGASLSSLLVARRSSRGTFTPPALGQRLDRIEELEPVVLHQELQRGAVRAAAEAVIELLLSATP
jgi:hypothetical protein